MKLRRSKRRGTPCYSQNIVVVSFGIDFGCVSERALNPEERCTESVSIPNKRIGIDAIDKSVVIHVVPIRRVAEGKFRDIGKTIVIRIG